MKKPLKTVGVLLCSLLLLAAAGCATIDGAGQDIESAGEAVQDAVDGE